MDACDGVQIGASCALLRKLIVMKEVHVRLLSALGCALMLVPFAATAEAPKKAPEEKVVCKRIYGADTGSHFQASKRICRKASDWEQLDRETDEAMRSFRDSARGDPNGPTQDMGANPQ
jgi:hypothetical protein